VRKIIWGRACLRPWGDEAERGHIGESGAGAESATPPLLPLSAMTRAAPASLRPGWGWQGSLAIEGDDFTAPDRVGFYSEARVSVQGHFKLGQWPVQIGTEELSQATARSRERKMHKKNRAADFSVHLKREGAFEGQCVARRVTPEKPPPGRSPMPTPLWIYR
jgi:hypothetical protein